MSFPETCCTKPPVSSDYVPKGKKETFGDMEVYIVGDSNAKATLFGFYDIFGYHNNTFLFCDRLAESGFRVILPDFFHGKPWSLENFPPSNFDDLKQWAFVDHSWANKVKKDTLFVLEHLKKIFRYSKKSAYLDFVGEEELYLMPCSRKIPYFDVELPFILQGWVKKI
ncbi:hypothetical protein DSO57_1000756 [Entomophthora muscae]|uniref:Uncharacterized protein n=1 Tax=Entomophthora muscae TaxID=34485 RepID=A0ACC2T9D7_9FUNG|nr:hypothetical protein DSO57_1000756 [Entomophthora muscae]